MSDTRIVETMVADSVVDGYVDHLNQVWELADKCGHVQEFLTALTNFTGAALWGLEDDSREIGLDIVKEVARRSHNPMVSKPAVN